MTPDDVTTMLRLLTDRRQQHVDRRSYLAARSQGLTAAKAEELLASVRPRDQIGKARKQLARELVVELAGIDSRRKDIKKRIATVLDLQPTSRLDEASELMAAAVVIGNDVRLLAEQLDPKTASWWVTIRRA